MTDNIKGLGVSMAFTSWQALTSMTVWIFCSFCKKRAKPGKNLKKSPSVTRDSTLQSFSLEAFSGQQQIEGEERKGRKHDACFFFFSFSMNKHLKYHMMAAQAEKYKGVAVRSNCDREDKLILNLLSCKCFWGVEYHGTQPAAKCKPGLFLYTTHVCGEHFSSEYPLLEVL